jgi:hypothetical protein
MKNKLTMVLASLALAAYPVSAHHAFAAEFDSNKAVTLNGTVVKMEWVNPHSWLHIEITNAAGKKEVWAVEGGSPGVMLRNGFKRDSFPTGTKVLVRGFGAKDGSLRANSRSIEFPDGRKLDTGSSYTGGKEDDTKGK